MKYFGKLAVLGAALAVSASSAFATTITPGSTANVPVDSLSSFTGGTPFVGGAGGTVSSSVQPSGGTPWGPINFTEAVYQGGSVQMCSTCLDFVFNWGPTVVPTGVQITDMVASFFTSTYAASAYYVSGSGVAPVNVSDSNTGQVDFYYGSGFTPGANGLFSDEIVIVTNATSTSGAGDFALVDGSTGSNSDLEPAGPTGFAPEPSSLMLLGTGLVGAAGMLMRRRQQQTAA